MVDFVLKKLDTAKVSKAVTRKRVMGEDGKAITLLTLDADAKSFGDDLTYVFQKNVDKARRRHKAAAGTARVASKN